MAWFLTQLTPDAAEQHDRRVYNAGPDVGLGWRPYTFRATRGAVAQFACHTDGELGTQLRKRGLRVVAWTPWRDGVRSARLSDV